MLTPLGDYFQNLEANVHSNVNLGEATLSLSQVNVGEDTLPSPVIPIHSPTIATATATIELQEEGEVATLSSQETAEPSSQRFVAETPPGTTGDVGATLHVASSPQVEMQDTDLGGGPVENDALKVKAHKGKGTTTVTLDFDDSDDAVFDEEVENARASRLTESTIDVNTGEKVAMGVSMGKFTCNFVLFDFEFYVSILIFDFASF